MKKLTTAALAGLVAVTAVANASMSRWNGFGSIGSSFIADVQDIWTLPGAVTNYKNALYTELGQNNFGYDSGVGDGYQYNYGPDAGIPYMDIAPSNPWGGAHLELGPGVLGVWVNRPVNDFNLSTPGYGSWSAPRNQVDLLYGWALSDATTLAIGLNKASDGYNDKYDRPNNDENWTDNSNRLGISLGLEQKNVGPISLLEAGLTFNMDSAEYTDKQTKGSTFDYKNTASGSLIGLRVGGDLAGENGAFGRVELGLSLGSASGKDTDNLTPLPANANQENSFSSLSYNLGYAAGKSSDKGLGLLGVMLNSRSETDTNKNYNNIAGSDYVSTYNYMNLAVGVAAEGKANSWLTLRGGLVAYPFQAASDKYQYYTSAANDTTDQYTGQWLWSGQDAQASFGTTITVGNLTVDGVLNQDILYTGGYLASGVSGALSTHVSATWAY